MLRMSPALLNGLLSSGSPVLRGTLDFAKQESFAKYREL